MGQDDSKNLLSKDKTSLYYELRIYGLILNAFSARLVVPNSMINPKNPNAKVIKIHE